MMDIEDFARNAVRDFLERQRGVPEHYNLSLPPDAVAHLIRSAYYASLIPDENRWPRASGVNLTFGASRPVVGVWLISAVLLLSYGGEGRGGRPGRTLNRGGHVKAAHQSLGDRPGRVFSRPEAIATGKRGLRRCAKSMSRPVSGPWVPKALSAGRINTTRAGCNVRERAYATCV